MAQFTQQINTGMNDAYKVVGGAWWNALNIINLGNNVVGFFRFTATGIGQGSTIDSAYFSVVGDYGGTNPLNLKVRAIDEDDTTDFSSDASGRDRTSEGVDWDIPTGWAHGVTKTTPDIKAVIQEVVNRPDFSGGAIAIVVENDGSSFNNSAHSFEGDSGEAASIVINYTGITTTYRTTTVIAKILNPPFDMGVIVTKPTYDVLADKDPTHHIFNSDYPTLKYYTSGSLQVYLAATDLAAMGSIEHNLGYEPYVEVYAETEIGDKFQYCPYSGAGVTVFYGSTFRVTSTHIYFYIESTGFAGDTYWNFKYFIFRNDTDL